MNGCLRWREGDVSDKMTEADSEIDIRIVMSTVALHRNDAITIASVECVNALTMTHSSRALMLVGWDRICNNKR